MSEASREDPILLQNIATSVVMPPGSAEKDVTEEDAVAL